MVEWWTGAGEGNRTLVVSLEGFCSTIELHPPISKRCASTGSSAAIATDDGARQSGNGFRRSGNAVSLLKPLFHRLLLCVCHVQSKL